MSALTKEVAERLRFDIGPLQRYLEDHVEGFSGELQVRQFRGGQSCPTYLLEAGGKSYVLRRKPPGKLLPSAHAVDREYRVMTALGDTDVPVPRTYCLCTDESVVGTMFFVMERVRGRVLWEALLPGMEPRERFAIYDAMNRTLARLHAVDYEAVGDPEGEGRSEGSRSGRARPAHSRAVPRGLLPAHRPRRHSALELLPGPQPVPERWHRPGHRRPGTRRHRRKFPRQGSGRVRAAHRRAGLGGRAAGLNPLGPFPPQKNAVVPRSPILPAPLSRSEWTGPPSACCT